MNDRMRTQKDSAQVTDMIEIQQSAVADHIADLGREGAALRAERTRDLVREHGIVHGIAPDGLLDRPAGLPSPRVRIGRWLVAIGEAIAGPARPPTTELSHGPRPSDGGPDQLERAA
jgi:hypothetical protein